MYFRIIHYQPNKQKYFSKKLIIMVKQKMEPTMSRLYNRVYVCMKCNAKIRADAEKVMAGKVKCRKCGYYGLRQKSKELKV